MEKWYPKVSVMLSDISEKFHIPICIRTGFQVTGRRMRNIHRYPFFLNGDDRIMINGLVNFFKAVSDPFTRSKVRVIVRATVRLNVDPHCFLMVYSSSNSSWY